MRLASSAGNRSSRSRSHSTPGLRGPSSRVSDAALPIPPNGLTFDAVEAAAEAGATGGRAVRVHKQRARYTVAGCQAERSVLEAGGHRTMSIAVESTNPADVVAGWPTLGLRLLQSRRPDGAAVARRSCAGALRSHRRRHELDQVPRRGARRGRAWPVADRRRSGDRDPARRGPRGYRRDRRRAARGTAHAISEMADEARSVDVRAIAVVGTAGSRMARNRAEVVETVRAPRACRSKSSRGGRGPARLSRRRDGRRARRRGNRRGRHGRRQFAVHVRPRADRR